MRSLFFYVKDDIVDTTNLIVEFPEKEVELKQKL